MRILLYGLNYAPELTGIGKYSGEMAEWLAGRGHRVRVVTTPPYYPAWRVRADYRWWAYRKERGPVTVYRCPLYVPQRPSGVSRLLHLASFMLSSLPVVMAQAGWRPEIVMTVEPAFMCVPGTLLAGRMAGAPAWLHIQDFEVDAAFDLGLLPREGWLHTVAEQLEQRLMRGFARVSTISHRMMERLPEKGVAQQRIVLFPNWVDTEAIQPLPTPSSLREELGLGPERVVLLYAGNMGMKQGLEILPELAQACRRDPRIHFIFCGDGAFHPQLRAMVEGMQNVTMLPLQPLDRLNDLLNTADIHLLPQRGDAADLVMPSKLTGMLASGRPVLATVAKGTQVATALEGCGTVVEPGDAAALLAAVERLADDVELRCAMGRAARAYAVEHMGRERVLERFEAELVAAVAEHRGRRG